MKKKAQDRKRSASRRRSGVSITTTKTGGFSVRSFGPEAPDLRTVLPQFLGSAATASKTVATVVVTADEDEECATCRGNGQIRDGETRELRRCLDCGGAGTRC